MRHGRGEVEGLSTPVLLPCRGRSTARWCQRIEGSAGTTYATPFATLALSAGEHYMQVSKWLGHSTFTLTLDIYGDYIREDDAAAPKFARPVVAGADNVVSFQKNA